MGLKEQLQAGAQLNRQSVVFTPTGTTGTVSIGGTYGILSIQTSAPCRLRLYEDSTSRSSDSTRPFTSSSVSSKIALIGDFSMSVAGIYTIDPMVFGHSTDTVNPTTYYTIEPAGPTITINRYLIEDTKVAPAAGTLYSNTNRRTINITTTGSLAIGQIYGDIISQSSIPQTYLLISASNGNAYPGRISRVRLYSTTSSLHDSVELNRSFSTEPSESAHLIVDFIVTGSDTFHFTPKMIGANLQHTGEDLYLIKDNKELIRGDNAMYYYIQNLSTASSYLSVDMYLYSLED